MTILTGAELSALRNEILQTLPESVVISRATLTTDDYGYTAESFAAVGTVVGRIDPARNRSERMIVGDNQAIIDERQLTVQWDADLRAGDRVSVGAVSYEIKQLDDNHSLRLVNRAVVSVIR